jgi:hypothetical protein
MVKDFVKKEYVWGSLAATRSPVPNGISAYGGRNLTSIGRMATSRIGLPAAG